MQNSKFMCRFADYQIKAKGLLNFELSILNF